MDRHSSDALTKEPEVKYLVEDMCEAYQDGIAIWDSRVKNLLIGSGRDVEAAIKLRSSFEEGIDVVGRSYRQYYKQAGKHFAVGDCRSALCVQSLHPRQGAVLPRLSQNES